jgi:hypothetical protein
MGVLIPTVTKNAEWHQGGDPPRPIPSSNNIDYFVKGVFMQNPTEIPSNLGHNLAVEYSNRGFNTFLSLWRFGEDDQMYTNYSRDCLLRIQENNMKVFAGYTQEALDVLTAYPELDDALTGFIMPDEPDMLKSENPDLAAILGWL